MEQKEKSMLNYGTARIGLIGLLVFIVALLVGMKTNGGSRLKLIEWRLPAEIQLMGFELEFLKPSKGIEGTVGGQEARREKVEFHQHVMDLHGFDADEYWAFIPQKKDRELREMVFSKDPELGLQARIAKLRTGVLFDETNLVLIKLVQQKKLSNDKKSKRELDAARSQPQWKKTLAWLESMSAAELAETRHKLESVERRTSENLEKLKEQYVVEFPRPENELRIYSQILLPWWKLKHDFFRQYNALTADKASYPRDRWDLVQKYRADLRDLLRSMKVQAIHFNKYQKENQGFLRKFLAENPKQREKVQPLIDELARQTPRVNIERAPGMAMVIGSVLHCAVPPVRCRGEDKKAATPAPGLDVELRTHGDDPKNPKEFHFSGRTNDQGQFVIPAVPPGDYEVFADLLLLDQRIHYRGNLRTFYVQGHEEVLILDLPVEKVTVTIRPGKPHKS